MGPVALLLMFVIGSVVHDDVTTNNAIANNLAVQRGELTENTVLLKLDGHCCYVIDK